MKTTQPVRRNDGVALIIVLGLLAVLTLLAVAFSVAMRVERLAARNFANGVRAQSLIETGLVRAMEDIDAHMSSSVYPVDMAWSSSGSPLVTDLLSGEAANALPRAVLVDPADLTKGAIPESAKCGWITANIPDGRVAFLTVDVGGLLDVNAVGGSRRTFGTNINEIDIGAVPEVSNTNQFFLDRKKYRRYETVPEIDPLNGGISGAGLNFETFSYDVNHDQYFSNSLSAFPCLYDKASAPSDIPNFGTRICPLMSKFNINSLTNCRGYYRPWDYNGYKDAADVFFNTVWRPAMVGLDGKSGIIGASGINVNATNPDRPTDVLWNIVNYIDPDRIPQGEKNYSYRNTEGAEPRPLINEIVWKKAADYNQTTNYEVIVELWYPFAPLSVKPSDKFSLKMAVDQKSDGNGAVSDCVSIGNHSDVLDESRTYTNWTFQIPEMIFGSSSEFLCYTGTFQYIPVGSTNGPVEIASDYPPPPAKPYLAYFYCQVRQECLDDSGATIVNPVDDAFGYDTADDGLISSKRRMFPLGATSIQNDSPWTIGGFEKEGQGYSVADPRSNGQVKYWTNLGKDWGTAILGQNYPPASHTLGRTNVNEIAYAWACGKSQGLPIWAKNGPMLNIGELGYVFRSNLDDEYDNPQLWWWQTLNLMNRNEGSTFLDLLTVRDPSQQVPVNGLFCINSQNKDAIKALLHGLQIGWTNEIKKYSYKLLDPDIQTIADTIYNTVRDPTKGPFMSFRTMFTADGQLPGSPGYIGPDAGGGGPLADAFRHAGINAVRAVEGPLARVNDICKEDPFRQICELITFRQNLFSIIIAAQALSPDPDGAGPELPSVLAEKRANALVYRDSYTGRYFVRSFKWLAD